MSDFKSRNCIYDESQNQLVFSDSDESIRDDSNVNNGNENMVDGDESIRNKINVGINGFGRIGKCTILQLLENPDFNIKVINTSLNLSSIQRYLNRDSNHGTRNYKVNILFNSIISINNHQIKIINQRDPNKIDWDRMGVKYLFETTGVFLTYEDLCQHNAPHVILSSPPKKSSSELEIPMFCYGVNHQRYCYQKIISVASCTTNCLAPFLDVADKISKIKEGSFITVHAATSSQNVTDSGHDNKRTNRSIFNNIIPHTTGASKCVEKILPYMRGKITGNSVRIPISIVSMIDINLTFHNNIKLDRFLEILDNMKEKKDINNMKERKDINNMKERKDINNMKERKDINNMKERRLLDIVEINKDNCVSSDFVTTDKPTIIDSQNCLQIGDNSIKFTLWYDNEWSYCAQMIRMCQFMNCKNTKIKRIVSL